MPLLHGKPFTSQETPADLKPGEGFKCEATDEVFRTREESVERTTLCNSAVWSCSLTKKPGLTYQEALASESWAREKLCKFPNALVHPLLHLASLTRRGHLDEVCEDVYKFAKKRYFPGEIVGVSGRDGTKQSCEILEVQSAPLASVANSNGEQAPNGGALVIRNTSERALCPARSRYKVKLVRADGSPPFVTKGKQMKRKKHLRLSRELLNLLLTQHCEKHGGVMRLKPSTASKFGLSDKSSQFFPDESLHFPSSSQEARMSEKDKAKKECQKRELKRPFPEEKPGKNKGLKRMKLAETGHSSSARKKQKKTKAMSSASNKPKQEQERPHLDKVVPSALEKQRREGLKRQIKEEKPRTEERIKRLKLEKEIQQNRLKEEKLASLAYEKQRKKDKQKRLKLGKEMERKRLKEEEQLRRKAEQEKLKAEKLMSLASEKQRKKDEQERIRLEKDMERKRLKEEEQLRKKEEQERLKAERLMFLASEKQRKKDEQERIKLEKEMERKRLKEEEQLRKKEEQEKLKAEKLMCLASEKQRKRDEQERIKLEKDMERQKLREEKRSQAEQMKLWRRPREDMECDDLKELPCPVPVHTRVPAELFGDVLMVLEFLYTFEDFFALKDKFPGSVTLEVLEEALVGSNPEGPLWELLKFFLSAIFQAQTEELEDARVTQLKEAHRTKTKPTRSVIGTVASVAAAWSQLHQGCDIKKLQLDSYTVSEILRLHILSSGADCDHSNAMFRFLKQGGFASSDDPCVELRTANPALLERLARTTVYDLTPGEKLTILQALCGKLLTFVKTRDFIAQNADEKLTAKQELRQIRAEQHRRDQEAAQKKEEEECRKKELEEKLEDHKEMHLTLSSTTVPISLPVEEQEEEQRKVKELQDRIRRASRNTSLAPLGRDRFYRQYWLVPSSCALFVEEDSFGLTEDMLEPRPTSTSQDGQQDTQVDTHSPTGGLPVANRWAFYSSVEEVKQLMEALNPRGHREMRLKEALQREEDQITQTLSNAVPNRYNYVAKAPECLAPAESVVERRLGDMLLDIEKQINEGNLGALKVADRETWRLALERGQSELPAADGRMNGEAKPEEEEMEVDDSLPVSGAVHRLRHALFQIEEGIERRFLHAPLGGEPKTKNDKKRMVLERWRESLQTCSSLSQVFVHLSTLERSISWEKSLLNIRCKLCRRKGGAETMIMCDGCDRGHHLRCLRPRVKSAPEGKWSCPDCRLKQCPVRPVRSFKRKFEDSEEESEEPKRSRTRSVAGKLVPAKHGRKGQQLSSRSGSLARKSSTASRSLRKRATPSSTLSK